MAAPPLPAAVAAMLATMLLAGCATSEEPFDVEVRSAPTEVRSEMAEADGPSPTAPLGRERGHLAGVVVDEAIRPIRGATVRLPTLGVEQVSDRDGSFGFVDLPWGSYFLQVNATGYRDAEAMVLVKEGEFTRAKVILAAIPPPQPYHVIQAREGFANASSSAHATTHAACQPCEFSFWVDPAGLRSLVVEAVFDGPPSGNERAFDACWGCGTVLCIGCSGQADPMRLELRGDDLEGRDTFHLQVLPTTSPAVEANVRFHVYATAFYHELPPAGWSFVAGDP